MESYFQESWLEICGSSVTNLTDHHIYYCAFHKDYYVLYWANTVCSVQWGKYSAFTKWRMQSNLNTVQVRNILPLVLNRSCVPLNVTWKWIPNRIKITPLNISLCTSGNLVAITIYCYIYGTITKGIYYNLVKTLIKSVTLRLYFLMYTIMVENNVSFIHILCMSFYRICLSILIYFNYYIRIEFYIVYNLVSKQENITV